MSSRAGEPWGVVVSVYAATHRGAVRTENQDAVAVGGWHAPRDGRVVRLERLAAPVTCVVADGAGGHRAGEEASTLAALELSVALGGEAGVGDIDEAVRRAHAALREEMAHRPETQGMATAAALVHVTARHALVANVGDCRAYDLTAGGAVQMSRDDRVAPGSSIVTQALGGVHADAPTAHVERCRIEPGLGFLLCSDGLHGVISDDDLARAAGHFPTDAALVGALIERALACGAPDNVAVAVIRVHPGEIRD